MACNAASVPGSAPGLRKIAAASAANRGATTEQLKAIFSWTDDAMPSLYTRSADRRRMAIAAMHKLGNDERTSIPAAHYPVRTKDNKYK